MFPITDPSRAGDIRMRRRRAVWLLVGIIVVPAMLFSGHDKSAKSNSASSNDDLHVDLNSLSIHSGSLPGTEIQSVLSHIPFVRSLNWMVEGAPLPAGRRDASALSATGTSLVVALSCAGSITLVPKSDLSDRVFVSTKDQGPGSTAGLLLTGSTRLTLSGACGYGHEDVVIQAPTAMPLTLVQTGDADLRLGAFTGPVRLTQNGSGDAVLDASGPLDVTKSGKGDLSVGRLSGSLHLAQTGSGDTTINLAEAAEVSATMEGSGDLTIPAGHIGRLAVVSHGSGDLSVAAEIGNAFVQAGQESDVTLPHVTGRLDRSVTASHDE